MRLEYRYSKLDKLHEYQITNENNIYNQWIWFYLGKYLKERKDEFILPYSYNPIKVLGKYKTTYKSAKEIARYIVNKIKNHRKTRRIK